MVQLFKNTPVENVLRSSSALTKVFKDFNLPRLVCRQSYENNQEPYVKTQYQVRAS